MKTIPAGRYLIGLELSGEVTTKMVIIPLGARNIPVWQKSFAVDEAEFGEFLQQRSARRRELIAKAAAANSARGADK